MKYFYSLYKTRITYKIDKEAFVAFVDLNKPDRYITNHDERQAIESLCNHFTAAGYCVIVRD